MSRIWGAVRQYGRDAWEAWNGFWFNPTDPATLGMIRVLAGAMLLYVHFIWSFDLYAFFGPNGWLPVDFFIKEHGLDGRVDEFGNLLPHSYSWSIFLHAKQAWLIWTIHIFALLTFFCLMVGLFSRVSAVLAAFFAIMYVARVTPGAFFGLDKVTCFLSLYLMLGPCGARYSIDSLLRKRRGNTGDPPDSISANLAIRMMQWHLAIVYLFSGLGKLQGETWWTGEATWLSIASLNYQSLDVTFLANYPWMLDLLTHATVFWELFYIVLIWNRWARPWMLLTAIGVHGFICLCLGMMTFGLAMLIANLAFVAPSVVRWVADPIANRITLALAGEKSGND